MEKICVYIYIYTISIYIYVSINYQSKKNYFKIQKSWDFFPKLPKQTHLSDTKTLARKSWCNIQLVLKDTVDIDLPFV